MARPADPAVRPALLAAAARILAEEGPAGLSVRRVAREVGTSTMAVYTHFGALDELVRAVVHAAFDRLAAEMAAVPTTDDPLLDLARLGLAYRSNALADPNLYGAMFGAQPTHLYQPTDADRLHALSTFETLVAAVQRCLDGRVIPAEAGDASDLAERIWAAAHGVVTLEIAGYLAERGAARFAATHEVLLLGLGVDRAALTKAYAAVTTA